VKFGLPYGSKVILEAAPPSSNYQRGVPKRQRPQNCRRAYIRRRLEFVAVLTMEPRGIDIVVGNYMGGQSAFRKGRKRRTPNKSDAVASRVWRLRLH